MIQSNTMERVSVRDLRNHGGDVLDRVVAGETLLVTRSGSPVAELRPLPRKPVTAEAVLERFSGLHPVDPEALRRDIDAIIDPTL